MTTDIVVQLTAPEPTERTLFILAIARQVGLHSTMRSTLERRISFVLWRANGRGITPSTIPNSATAFGGLVNDVMTVIELAEAGAYTLPCESGGQNGVPG